jgi:tetratricopeptide (TPR) repeat protein
MEETHFNETLTLARSLVQAEENFPPPPTQNLSAATGPAQSLLLGALAFNQGRYQEALAQWDPLEKARPDNLALGSLAAAAHLRERNYSLAAQKYQKALAAPPPANSFEELARAKDELGLSLALFQLRDYPGAQANAQKAYQTRVKRLGPLRRETLSAANILASALIAQQKNDAAVNLLTQTAKETLNRGGSLDDPVLADGLHLLALAYSLTNRTEELESLTLVLGAESPEEAETTLGNPETDPPQTSPSQTGQTQDSPPQTGPAASEPQQPPASGPTRPKGQPAEATLAPETEASAQSSALRLGPDFLQAYALWTELKTLEPASPLLPLLLTALIHEVNGGQPSGQPLGTATPRVLIDPVDHATMCLELADFRLQNQEPRSALAILGPLSQWAPPAQAPEVAATMGEALAALGQWPEAELAYRAALAATPTKLDQAGINQVVTWSIALAQTILKQGRLVEEAELELVGAQTRLKKQAPRKELQAQPAVARLCLYLAEILPSQGRSKDRANYQREAQRILRQAKKAHPDQAQEIATLEARLGSGRKRPAPEPAGAPTPTRPSPEAVRLELQGYQLLKRLEDFEPRIQTILEEVESQAGPNSSLYRRYLSLWLQYLEDKGDTQALLAELDLMAQNSLADNQVDQSRFAVAALSYKAKVLTQSGQRAAALATYQRLLSNPRLSARLSEAQAEKFQGLIKELESDSAAKP